MDTFRKENLVFKYTWSPYEKDDPRVSGIPDNTKFDRKEGQEVLYIISSLTDHVAWGVEGFGERAEKLIHEQLPEGITTQSEVIRWIKANWKPNSTSKTLH